MATYYGHARTNLFQVKDAAAFIAELATISTNLDVAANTETNEVAVFSNTDDGCWIWNTYKGGTWEESEVNWADIFTRHLAPNSVAVITEIGNEKLRYLNGYAVAYNPNGEKTEIMLDDIYSQARKLWNLEVKEN